MPEWQGSALLARSGAACLPTTDRYALPSAAPTHQPPPAGRPAASHGVLRRRPSVPAPPAGPAGCASCRCPAGPASRRCRGQEGAMVGLGARPAPSSMPAHIHAPLGGASGCALHHASRGSAPRRRALTCLPQGQGAGEGGSYRPHLRLVQAIERLQLLARCRAPVGVPGPGRGLVCQRLGRGPAQQQRPHRGLALVGGVGQARQALQGRQLAARGDRAHALVQPPGGACMGGRGAAGISASICGSVAQALTQGGQAAHQHNSYRNRYSRLQGS